MKKSFYQLSILVILVGTIFIGVRYLLSSNDPLPELAPATEQAPISNDLPIEAPQPTSTPILPPQQSPLSGEVYYFYGDWESATKRPWRLLTLLNKAVLLY